MSNMFKTNSRFAALVEPAFNEVISKAEKPEEANEIEKEYDTDNKPRNNNFLRNERPVYNDSNIFSQKVVDKARLQRKNDEHERLMVETGKILSIDNFPELQLSKNTDNSKNTISFAEKLKQKEVLQTNNKSSEKPVISFSEKLKHVDVVVETKVNEIPYGWAVIKRDKVTNKSITEYNKEYEKDLKKAENLEKKQWPWKVLGALVDLYERERDTYINKWGYDAYEEKYLDPDYDDEYFDRLDEEYAASESEEEYESEDDEEYNVKSNYYWKH